MIQAVCDTLSDEKCAEMTQIQSQGLSRVRWNHTNRPILSTQTNIYNSSISLKGQADSGFSCKHARWKYRKS